MVAVACSASTTTTGGSADAQSDALVHSANCPSQPPITGYSCASFQTDGVCDGTVFCSACGKEVMTTCSCVPKDGAYAYQCEDNCSSCAGDASAGDSAQGKGVCYVVDPDATFAKTRCTESASEDREKHRTQCASTKGGTWQPSCPPGYLGKCTQKEGTTYFYDSAIADLEKVCATLGGTWEGA